MKTGKIKIGDNKNRENHNNETLADALANALQYAEARRSVHKTRIAEAGDKGVRRAAREQNARELLPYRTFPETTKILTSLSKHLKAVLIQQASQIINGITI